MALKAMARLRAPPSPAATSSPTGTGPLPNAAWQPCKRDQDMSCCYLGMHETQPHGNRSCRQDPAARA